jgi:hypothetical protein
VRLLFYFLAALAVLGQRRSRAEDKVATAWTCVSADSHAPREDPPTLRMYITRRDPLWGPYATVDGKTPYRNDNLREEREWSLWPDGSVELTTTVRGPRPANRLRQYACSATYHRTALLRFLSVVSETGICSQGRWQDRLSQTGLLHRTTVYELDLRIGRSARCRTTLHKGKFFLDRKLYKVVGGWAKLEQSICGACQLPADGTWRFLYDYRSQYAGYP